MYNHACISIYSTYEVRDRDCDSEVSRFKSIPGAVHIYFYQHSLSSGNYRAKTSFPFLPPTAFCVSASSALSPAPWLFCPIVLPQTGALNNSPPGFSGRK